MTAKGRHLCGGNRCVREATERSASATFVRQATSAGNHGDVALVSILVDRLPSRLWKAGNYYLSARLHFCIGRHPEGRTVRTVEWQGRELAHGDDSARVPPHD